MNRNLALLLLSGFLFGACSEKTSSDTVAGGGFETSDLQGKVVDSSGKTVVGARVWLLQNSTDSTVKSVVMDSSLSDTSGRVNFAKWSNAPGVVGFEAWSGDSLVQVIQKLDRPLHAAVQIVLQRPRLLTLPCTAFVQNELFLPGSHFVQKPPTVCLDTFHILVPQGQWNLMAVPPQGGPGPRYIPVHGDSLPPWAPPMGDPGKGYGPPPPLNLDSLLAVQRTRDSMAMHGNPYVPPVPGAPRNP